MLMSANYFAAVLSRKYGIGARVLGNMLTAGSTNCIEMKLLCYTRKKPELLTGLHAGLVSAVLARKDFYSFVTL